MDYAIASFNIFFISFLFKSIFSFLLTVYDEINTYIIEYISCSCSSLTNFIIFCLLFKKSIVFLRIYSSLC